MASLDSAAAEESRSCCRGQCDAVARERNARQRDKGERGPPLARGCTRVPWIGCRSLRSRHQRRLPPPHARAYDELAPRSTDHGGHPPPRLFPAPATVRRETTPRHGDSDVVAVTQTP
ncbi:hypothetical protein MTO96_022250 [Rhipicephalus appendiculatus]